MTKKYRLKKEWLNDQFGTLYKKGEGFPVSVRTAVEQALVTSDNIAALMLFDVTKEAQGTYTPNILGFIDANYAETPSQQVLIDSRSHTAILKYLYFARHLNKDNSQEILSYLAKSSSTDRLGRQIPDNITIANKIGAFNDRSKATAGLSTVLSGITASAL